MPIKAVLVLSLTAGTLALAQGSWMKQVSGIGRGSTRQLAETYARQNLRGELDAHEELCHSQGGAPTTEEWDHALCDQGPLNWQCTIGGKITCRF